MLNDIKSEHIDSVKRRFFLYADVKDGCWGWKASFRPSGYGGLWVNNKNYSINRISWILHFGTIPEGLFVLHKCDNPVCANPNHLFLGTMMDNSKDKISKGRSNCNKKLSQDQINDIIKRSFELNECQKQIASLYSITPQAVRYVIKKEEAKRGKIFGTNKKTTIEMRKNIKELRKNGFT